MTFTYTNDPASSPVDAVRFLVGDMEPDEALLQDEEISWIITQWEDKNSIYYAASMAAEAIAAKFAREVTVSSDSQTVGTSELQQKYLELAVRLREQHKMLLTGGIPDVGGISSGEQPDPTVTSPAFGTGMHDYGEAGQQDMGDRGPTYIPEYWGYGDR